MTQEQFVQMLYNFDDDAFAGVDTVTLSRWENGVSNPPQKRKTNLFLAIQEATGQAFPLFDATSEENEARFSNAQGQSLAQPNRSPITHVMSGMIEEEAITLQHFRDLPNKSIMAQLFHAIHFSRSNNALEVAPEHFATLAEHPSAYFLTAMFHDQAFGAILAIKLTESAGDAFFAGELSAKALGEEHFAAADEKGYMAGILFFAYSHNTATRLLMRFYAHLLANQENLLGMGAYVFTTDTQKFLERLGFYKQTEAISPQESVHLYYASLNEMAANPHILNMIFND